MILFLATTVRVFLLGLQTQNVVGGYYWWATGTSYLLGVADMAIILLVLDYGWDSWWIMGTGGAAGVTGSMWVHRRWVG